MTMRRSSAPTLAATVLVTGAACGGFDDPGRTGRRRGGAATQSQATSGYPMSIENCGATVTLRSEPQRIVSLNQGSTEILLSLGVADRMVGTATWTDPVLPTLAAQNDKVKRLAENNPALEVVLAQEPDFVTASFINTLSAGGVGEREAFDKLGVPTYMSPSECLKSAAGKGDDGARNTPLDLSAITDEVTQLGRLTGVPEKATQVNAALEQRIQAATARQAKPGTSVVYWFANSEQPYVAGGHGAPGIISRALGLTNVYADHTQEWPQVGWEDFAAKDPDVIVIGDLTRRSQTAETAAAKIAFLERNPVTQQMSAVQKKRYIAVAGGDMNPSLRTVDGIEKVSAGLARLGFE